MMKINKEGQNIIMASALALTLASSLAFAFLPEWLFGIVFLLGLLGFLFVLFFFREPTRRPLLQDPSLVYAPADGKVVVIEEITEKEYLGQKCIQVSVFMSLTNVHINWYPVSGEVVYFKHHHGEYMVAWHPKSSEENERTTTVVDTGRDKILFRQIAGYVARRIVSYSHEGSIVQQNRKCGVIKFGSRVDVMLPPDSEILVEMGQKVKGTQTPIARLKNRK